MSEPYDRYADTEPLFPAWAAPIYLWVSLLASAVYLGLDMVVVSMPGLALTKALGVGLLALYAVFSRAPALALALALSACGDYALAMDPQRTEAGIAFFAGAHLLYIGIFAMALARHGVRKDGFVLAVALAAYGAAMWLWLSPGMGDLQLMASAYLGVILIMAAVAALVNGPRLITLGALLFVVSDSILAAGWFRGLDISWVIDIDGALVWITYYGAQLALAIGIVRLKGQHTGAPPEEQQGL
ncbi:MAG: lysoplasmalogenase family protein [Oceanicaulis sp.]